jgi:hypothetical protein
MQSHQLFCFSFLLQTYTGFSNVVTFVTSIKNLFCSYSVSCALPGFMVVSHDACPFCDNQFCGKRNFVRCGVCDIGIHWVCLQLDEADQATITETGKSAFKHDAYAKTLALAAMIRPRTNHSHLSLMEELRVALHLTKRPFRLSFLLLSTEFETIRPRGQYSTSASSCAFHQGLASYFYTCW